MNEKRALCCAPLDKEVTEDRKQEWSGWCVWSLPKEEVWKWVAKGVVVWRGEYSLLNTDDYWLVADRTRFTCHWSFVFVYYRNKIKYDESPPEV